MRLQGPGLEAALISCILVLLVSLRLPPVVLPCLSLRHLSLKAKNNVANHFPCLTDNGTLLRLFLLEANHEFASVEKTILYHFYQFNSYVLVDQEERSHERAAVPFCGL